MASGSKRGKMTRKPASKPRRSNYKKKLAKPKISINKKTSSSVLEDLPLNSSTLRSDNNISKIDGVIDDIIEGVDENDQTYTTTTTTSSSPAAATSTCSPCSTPKAPRFRIPKIDTCPPAPKKQRVLSNCSLQRTPIAFFAPPDLELFFFFALRDISV